MEKQIVPDIATEAAVLNITHNVSQNVRGKTCESCTKVKPV